MTELSSDLLHLQMHARQDQLRDRAVREQRGVARDRAGRRRTFPWPARHAS